MKKRYLNLALLALAALLVFSSCSSGDDGLKAWDEEVFKAKGLGGLERPISSMLPTGGVQSTKVSNVTYSVDYVRWDTAPAKVYTDLIANIDKKLAAAGITVTGKTSGDNPASGSGQGKYYKATFYTYTYQGDTVNIKVYHIKANSDNKVIITGDDYTTPNGDVYPMGNLLIEYPSIGGDRRNSISFPAVKDQLLFVIY
jgi:hypothetical protein